MPSYSMDRVCETSTTTGTGDFTLAGAVPGYRVFDDVADSSGNLYYLIEAVDDSGLATGQWETGLGLLADPTTLERLVVLDDDQASGTQVDFASGTKRVHLAAPAYALQYKSLVTKRNTDLTGQNFTTATAIAWTGGSDFDTTDPYAGNVGAIHDPVTDNSRMTIPAELNVAHCKFHGQVALQNITSGVWVELSFRVDGSTIIARHTFATPNTSQFYQISSPPYYLSTGQYVEMLIQVQTDTSVDIMAVGSFFQIEIVQ